MFFFFVLCSLSAAISEKECEQWVQGLSRLNRKLLASPYPSQMERWLRKEFYHIKNTRDTYAYAIFHKIKKKFSNIDFKQQKKKKLFFFLIIKNSGSR